VTLATLVGPGSYPNLFRDLLGKNENEIAIKIGGAFNQLFHGDPANEAIYVTTGTDQAYILDVLHNEIRTEGIGMGMLIAVQLDKRDEFDRLWRYTKSIQLRDGAGKGYLPSYCNNNSNATSDYVCNDPYGLQLITMDMLLARGRWRSAPAGINYGAEASDLLDVIRYKEANNCGVVDGVTGTFDPKAHLPYDTPTTFSAGISRPSIVMPAFYDLWAQATGDSFWSQAATAGREYWRASAHPATGLIPLQATFDGKPVPGFDTFAPECDRAFFNMAFDRLWMGTGGWLTDESNRVLQFFYSQGITGYGQTYSLDGTAEIVSLHDMPLVSANGALAVAATMPRRADFVSEVWALTTPTGNARYYSGIMHLLAMLFLSGQMRVY
jgi:oligosaccharide reducing-end xylanase